jgi:hypothetical protein
MRRFCGNALAAQGIFSAGDWLKVVRVDTAGIAAEMV